jgi:hypothetical protein
MAEIERKKGLKGDREREREREREIEKEREGKREKSREREERDTTRTKRIKLGGILVPVLLGQNIFYKMGVFAFS